MIRNALSFVFLAGFLVAQSVAETPFENFVVAVWPEYDHPGVLVICTGTVKSDRLPLTLEVRVPDETTVVMAVGQSDTVSDLSPVDLVQRAGGQWVDLTVVRNSFQLEYYFNPFTASEKSPSEDHTATQSTPCRLSHRHSAPSCRPGIYLFREGDGDVFRRTRSDVLPHTSPVSCGGIRERDILFLSQSFRKTQCRSLTGDAGG